MISFPIVNNINKDMDLFEQVSEDIKKRYEGEKIKVAFGDIEKM